MKRATKVVSILLLTLFGVLGFGQTKRQLNNKLKRNREQLALTRKALDETHSQKKATLRTLRTFEKQIELREEVLLSMEDGMISLENDIELAEVEISGITAELDRIKKEFSESIVAGYKNSRKVTKMHFVFLSTSFNDLIRRLNYLQRVIEFRKLQLELIEKKKEENSEKVNSLVEKKKEMAFLIEEQVKESDKLRDDKEIYEKLIDELKGKEKQLRAEIKEREKRSKELENEIRSLIEQEQTDPNPLQTAESGFKRFSLPWPVKVGFIAEQFGRHKHEDLRNITTQNNGVNIGCEAGARVFPVFDGVVSAVMEVPGMQTTVLVKHGEYFSVYANLDVVSCSGGQNVTPEDEIGRAGRNPDGAGELHFEIWSGTTKLNPENWLAPR
ncbi:MAG: peptidoglycan DD-metalloendopeptidase family protein [Bacteroidia bacterium]|nr:peptidoglycan DD-metalloendopeptidase family protein [Bacteroidia bacterium]